MNPDNKKKIKILLLSVLFAIIINLIISAVLKSFATDGPVPEIMRGARAESTYKFMGDEHGAVVYPPGNNKTLTTGDRISCIVPHCDPTVNLSDNYHCMKGNMLVQIIPIDARGNS